MFRSALSVCLCSLVAGCWVSTAESPVSSEILAVDAHLDRSYVAGRFVEEVQLGSILLRAPAGVGSWFVGELDPEGRWVWATAVPGNVARGGVDDVAYNPLLDRIFVVGDLDASDDHADLLQFRGSDGARIMATRELVGTEHALAVGPGDDLYVLEKVDGSRFRVQHLTLGLFRIEDEAVFDATTLFSLGGIDVDDDGTVVVAANVSGSVLGPGGSNVPFRSSDSSVVAALPLDLSSATLGRVHEGQSARVVDVAWADDGDVLVAGNVLGDDFLLAGEWIDTAPDCPWWVFFPSSFFVADVGLSASGVTTDWADAFGSCDFAQVRTLDASHGHVTVAGEFEDLLELGADTHFSAGSRDVFTARWTVSSGKLEGSTRAGGFRVDRVHDNVANNPTSRPAATIVGSYQTPATFPVAYNTNTQQTTYETVTHPTVASEAGFVWGAF